MRPKDNKDKSSRFFDGYVGAGCWEPLTQRLRMGVAPSDWKERSENELDEKWIEFLAEHGVTSIITVYSKGFGLKTEEPIRERGRKLAELAHKYGMAACAYLSDTVMLETFALEEPDVVNWLQVGADGEPVFYGGDQTHRRKGCYNNPAWREYMKQMIALAHEDGYEATQPDNDVWWPEPDGCRCKHCRDKFRNFLKERYPTPEACMDRLGLPTLDAVEPPRYGTWFKPWDLDGIRNPLVQEWLRFRCYCVHEFRGNLWQYVRSEFPGKHLLLPSMGITNRNMAWVNGEDHNLTVGQLPTWSTEEPLPCVYDEESGVVGCKIRSMRLARRTGTIMMHNAYISHERGAKPEAMLAEGIAFNQGALGGVAAFHWGEQRWPDYNEKYVQFLRKHLPLLTRVGSMAEVAMLRSSATLAFDGQAKRTCATLMEQLLIQSNILFDIILDRHLDDLARYKILILPGTTCMSDSDAAAIAEWVKAGGRLLATDDASFKDQWCRKRPFPALAGIYAWHEGDESRGRRHRYCSYGKGAAAWVPKIEHTLGEPDSTNRYYHDYKWNRWRLPDNSVEIVSTLRQLGYDQLLVSFPRWVVCELIRPEQANGLVLHAINYRKGCRQGTAAVSLRAPEGWQSVKAVTLSPEWDGVTPVDAHIEGGRIIAQSPEFDTFCMLHFTKE